MSPIGLGTSGVLFLNTFSRNYLDTVVCTALILSLNFGSTYSTSFYILGWYSMINGLIIIKSVYNDLKNDKR